MAFLIKDSMSLSRMFGWYIYFYCTISGCHPVSYSELCPATLSVSDMCCSLSALLIFAMPWKKSSTWHAWKIKLKAIRLTWQHPSSKVAMHSVGVSAVIEPPIRGGSDSRETPCSRISGEGSVVVEEEGVKGECSTILLLQDYSCCSVSFDNQCRQGCAQSI